MKKMTKRKANRPGLNGKRRDTYGRKVRFLAFTVIDRMRRSLNVAQVSACGNDPELAAVDITYILNELAPHLRRLRQIDRAWGD